MLGIHSRNNTGMTAKRAKADVEWRRNYVKSVLGRERERRNCHAIGVRQIERE
jgi:hypothetical protein